MTKKKWTSIQHHSVMEPLLLILDDSILPSRGSLPIIITHDVFSSIQGMFFFFVCFFVNEPMMFVDWTVPLNVDASQEKTTQVIFIWDFISTPTTNNVFVCLLLKNHQNWRPTIWFATLSCHRLFLRHLLSAFNVRITRSHPRAALTFR